MYGAVGRLVGILARMLSLPKEEVVIFFLIVLYPKTKDIKEIK